MRDRSFGPTVLLGVAGAVLAAVAAARDWADASGDAAGVAVTGAADGASAAPLALALALVALASWGVVLVLRGRARAVAAGLGLLAGVGVLVAVAVAHDAARSAAVDAVVASGATGDAVVASLTGWYWATGAGAVLSTLASAVAVRQAPRWPAMGTRYDAPAGRSSERGPGAGGPTEEQDLWRALDEGRDPTA